MSEIQSLLDRYVAALQAGAVSTNEYPDHSLYMECLAATQRMQMALEQQQLGSIAADLHVAQHVFGWTQLPGPEAERAAVALQDLAAAVLAARLANRPDAW